MPAVTRSQSTRRPSDSPPPGLQPTPRRRRRRSITKSEADSTNNEENEPDNKTENDQTGQAIQLNLPLALPAPFNRQLLSLCFHASWRTRRRLRIHFSNRSEVLLDDTSSSEDDDSEHHDNLTVISYAPIAVPSRPPRHRWLLPLLIASLVAITLIAAALLQTHLHEPPPRPRPITLRNLTTLVHPYARLLRLLDTAPTAVLPAVQREFAELCALARPLAIPADECHDVVDLLDDAGVHLARVVGGIRVAGPGNLVGALRDTVLLMAWGIDQQRQEQGEEKTQEGGGGGVWNATAEGIFRAVAGQLPNWWDDHNALAVPVQSALEALRAARGMEGDMLSAFKRGVGSLDPNEFPAEDVFYAYDRLFTPLLPRRDALVTALEAATEILEDAAGRVYEFNATLHGIRADAEGTRGGYAFERVEALLGRVKEALGVLEHEMEAVGVRERQRLRDGEGGEGEEVEEKRPRRRREREEEKGRRAWWRL